MHYNIFSTVHLENEDDTKKKTKEIALNRTLEKMSKEDSTWKVAISSCDLIYLKVQFMDARIS